MKVEILSKEEQAKRDQQMAELLELEGFKKRQRAMIEKERLK